MVSCNVVLLLFWISGAFCILPEGWKACNQSSLDYEECLKKQINNAIHFLKNGNTKMGIVPLEPLHFKTMDVQQGTGPVRINIKMKNVSFSGLSQSKAIIVRNDWKQMYIKFSLSRWRIDGEYTMDGQIMFLIISGTGTFYLDLENTEYTLNITFKQVLKNGNKYFQVDKMPVVLSSLQAFVHFDNLFDGNKELGENMNLFFNENWSMIINEIKPAISRTLETGYKKYINRILSHMPIQKILVK